MRRFTNTENGVFGGVVHPIFELGNYQITQDLPKSYAGPAKLTNTDGTCRTQTALESEQVSTEFIYGLACESGSSLRAHKVTKPKQFWIDINRDFKSFYIDGVRLDVYILAEILSGDPYFNDSLAYAKALIHGTKISGIHLDTLTLTKLISLFHARAYVNYQIHHKAIRVTIKGIQHIGDSHNSANKVAVKRFILSVFNKHIFCKIRPDIEDSTVRVKFISAILPLLTQCGVTVLASVFANHYIGLDAADAMSGTATSRTRAHSVTSSHQNDWYWNLQVKDGALVVDSFCDCPSTKIRPSSGSRYQYFICPKDRNIPLMRTFGSVQIHVTLDSFQAPVLDIQKANLKAWWSSHILRGIYDANCLAIQKRFNDTPIFLWMLDESIKGTAHGADPDHRLRFAQLQHKIQILWMILKYLFSLGRCQNEVIRGKLIQGVAAWANRLYILDAAVSDRGIQVPQEYRTIDSLIEEIRGFLNDLETEDIGCWGHACARIELAISTQVRLSTPARISRSGKILFLHRQLDRLSSMLSTRPPVGINPSRYRSLD